MWNSIKKALRLVAVGLLCNAVLVAIPKYISHYLFSESVLMTLLLSLMVGYFLFNFLLNIKNDSLFMNWILTGTLK